MKKLLPFFAIMALTCSTLAQQKPKLVKDINTRANDSYPMDGVVSNNTLFLTATDVAHGTELWKSDGTPSGTVLVADIALGNTSSKPYNLFPFNSKVLFNANGTELWVSDGTVNGTQKIGDALLTVGAEVNGLYIFGVTDTLGRELWVTDGTANGTKLLMDIYPGASSSNPTQFTAIGNKVFFTANTADEGQELWLTDGTANGTQMVEDIRTGTSGSSPNYLASHKGKLYFSANNGVNGGELWTSDGTESGTYMVADMIKGSKSGSASEMVSNGHYLFFSAIDSVKGRELWRSDGTDTGTYVLKDLDPWGSFGPYNLVAAGKNIYFMGDGDVGRELYFSDGTSAGTKLTRDLFPIQTDANILFMTAVGDSLFFSAHSSPHYGNYELHMSNGTRSGTKMVKDIIAGANPSRPDAFVAFKNKLFFSVDDSLSGKELWVSDGTSAGTKLFKDINAGTMGSGIDEMVSFNKGVVFTPLVSKYGREFWFSNGNNNGTQLVKDINSGSQSSDPNHLVSTGDYVYAYVYPGRGSGEMYSTDGTDQGTSYHRLTSVNDYLSLLTPIGKKVLFARRSSFNEELWAYEHGDAAFRVKKINPNGLGADVANFVNVNGTLFFTADDGNTSGIELWKSDGTGLGTQLVKDIRPSYFDSRPSNLTPSGKKLYFLADDGTNGRELWVTDGNEDSTKMVIDFNTSGSSLYVGMMGDGNGNLLFSKQDTVYGNELWFTDGTAKNTKLVKDLNSGKTDGFQSFLLSANGKVWFMASDGTNGSELWVTDGTVAGTYMVKNITDGAAGTEILNAVAVRDKIYFSANDGKHGLELWESDGTESGTKMVYDQMPGIAGSEPRLMTLHNDTLYFVANSVEYGEELFTIFTNCLAPSFSNASSCPGDSVVFTNHSDSLGLDDVSYVWSINGQIASTDVSPKLRFDSAKTYVVTLEMKAPDCQAEFQKEHVVNALPTADFSIEDDTLCLKDHKFKFTNTTVDPNDENVYQWRFSDGKTLNQKNASKTFNTTGEHEVTLAASYEGCEDVSSQKVFVTTPPQITSVTGKTLTTTDTDTFSVTNNTGSTYKWEVINGTITNGANTHEIVVEWDKDRKKGIVRVTETDAMGCEGDRYQHDVDLDFPESVGDINASLLSVYPNPTEGTLFIEWPESESTVTQVQLINQAGKVVANHTYSMGGTVYTMPLHHLENGMYILKVTTDSAVMMQQVVLMK